MSWFSPGPRKRGPASKVSRVGRRLLRRTRNTSKALGLHRDLMRHWITSFQLLNRNPTSQRFAKYGKGFQRAPLRGIIDRKSVVSGKSVSVRVDLGGRRIIKKKK